MSLETIFGTTSFWNLKVGLFSFQNINLIGNNFSGITLIIIRSYRNQAGYFFSLQQIYVRVYLGSNLFKFMTSIRETDRETENLIKNNKCFKAKKQPLYRFRVDKWKVFFHQIGLTRN